MLLQSPLHNKYKLHAKMGVSSTTSPYAAHCPSSFDTSYFQSQCNHVLRLFADKTTTRCCFFDCRIQIKTRIKCLRYDKSFASGEKRGQTPFGNATCEIFIGHSEVHRQRKTTGTRRGRQVPLSNLKGMARIRVRQNGAAFGSVPFFPSCPFPPFAISLPPPALCSLCGLCGYPLPAPLPPTGFACGTTELFLSLLPPHHLRKGLHAVIAPLRLALFPGGDQIPQATGHFPRQQVLPHAGRATPVVVHRIQGAGPIGASAEIGAVLAHGGPLTPSPPGGSPASAAAGIPGRCSG